jgi:hypothetical protein
LAKTQEAQVVFNQLVFVKLHTMVVQMCQLQKLIINVMMVLVAQLAVLEALVVLLILRTILWGCQILITEVVHEK